MTPADIAHYKSAGYVLLRGAIPARELDAVEAAFSQHAHSFGFWDEGDGGVTSPTFVKWLKHTEAGSIAAKGHLYDAMRDDPALKEFAGSDSIFGRATELLNTGVVAKAHRFRIDLPHDTRHLAVWHQDHHYVGGSVDTVTAWVPLQDVDWVMGPLLVVPESHYGPVAHNVALNGRKTVDSFEHIFSPEPRDTNIHMVEMRRGDLLLFHSLLLHSGQVNLSDHVRYSIQARYEPL